MIRYSENLTFLSVKHNKFSNIQVIILNVQQIKEISVMPVHTPNFTFKMLQLVISKISTHDLQLNN
jgi:hypothetical protein